MHGTQNAWGFLPPITSLSARRAFSVVSTENVTISSVRTPNEQTSFHDLPQPPSPPAEKPHSEIRTVNIAVRIKRLLSISLQLHGGTDLVHDVLCAGIKFIATQSIFMFFTLMVNAKSWALSNGVSNTALSDDSQNCGRTVASFWKCAIVDIPIWFCPMSLQLNSPKITK